MFHKLWPLASDPDVRMRLMAMAVDTGGEAGVTDNAYRFWRRCRVTSLGNRVFLLEGDGLRRDRLINRTFPDNTGRSAAVPAGGDVALWLVRTDAFKDRVNNALWRDAPGPNYIHFPTGWGGGFTMS